MPSEVIDARQEHLFHPRRRAAIRRRLLGWYDRYRRDLPWRRRPNDGYAQLLAEVMLQQTQAATASAYYERLIERFPTVDALADASLDDVLTLWSGLGYYRRARHLHAAARIIVAEHGSIVPADVDTLMALPGIGRYTAGAIASVAYDVRAPVLDGNVKRVLMRLSADASDPRDPVVQVRLWQAAEELLPRKRCGDFNQAMMELGATVCVPRSPNCSACPLCNHCRAYGEGLTGRIPAAGRRAKVSVMTIVVAAIKRGDTLLLVRRPPGGLWAGLWELPSEPVADGEPIEQVRRRLRERLPARCRLRTTPVGHVTRQLTHRRVMFHVYQGWLSGLVSVRKIGGQPARWVKPANVAGLGISRACQAVLQLVCPGGSSAS